MIHARISLFPALSIWLILLALIVGVTELSAQTHTTPPHKSDGEPGPVTNSFVIAWEPFPDAVAYEYVVTDNEFCFIGCSGDTRNRIVTDTFAIEFNMQVEVPYYWITRVHLSNGDTTRWTLISSFKSITPPVQSLITVAPNPVTDNLRIQFDWGADPNARRVQLSLFDLQGRQPLPEQTLTKIGTVTRFEEQIIPLHDLTPGVYFVNLLVTSDDEFPAKKEIHKIIVR